jgi:DNA polymerase-4
MTRWVLHVDLDQFIAAVEVLRHPELRGRPVVVGGDGDPAKRGVVATASYEAREHGVHSGLPMRTAARRCPDAVFLPADRPTYEAASAEVMTALRELGYVTEELGWDEAFVAAETDDPEAVGGEIQQQIKAATRLESSVGIGENRIQAKLASNFAKPHGIFRLTHQNWFAVMGGLPTGKLLGIGAKTERKLAELGIGTVAELADADIAAVAARPDDRAVAGADRTRPGFVGGLGRALRAALAQPRDHLPAEHRGLGAGTRGGAAAGRAGDP